jgi:TPR repeat protein
MGPICGAGVGVPANMKMARDWYTRAARGEGAGAPALPVHIEKQKGGETAGHICFDGTN